MDLQFTASVELGADQAIVRFGGELDLSTHGPCRRYVEEIAAATDGVIVFDLSRLAFIDGAGLMTLVESAGRLQPARSVRFVIPPRGPVRRLVDLLRSVDGDLWHAVTGARAYGSSGAVAESLPAHPNGARVGTVRPRLKTSSIELSAPG